MLQRHIHIADIILNGIVFDPKNAERVSQMDLNDLTASVKQLFDLLDEREIDFVVVGGIAMLAYVEGRNTQDIDLILSKSDLSKLPELVLEDDNSEFARGKFGELQVDLLFTSNKLFKRVATEHVVQQAFADRRVPCATEEGLLLLKLFALPSLYRQGQTQKARLYETDIAALIERRDGGSQELLKQLEGFLLDSDLEELQKIVTEIEERLAKEKSRFQ